MSLVLKLLRRLWPTKIRWRLILGIALIQLLVMTAFVLYLVSHQRQFLRKQNLQQTFNFVNDYAINSTPYVMANDFDELERLTLSHINFPNLEYAMIISPEGVVLAHTNTTYIGTRVVDSVSLQLKGETRGKVLVENEHLLDIAVPVIIDKKMVGWARAGVGQDYIRQNMISIVRRAALYIILALVLSILFAVVVANQLSKGLYRLIATADDIKEGDRNTRAPAFQTFELSQLGTAFNRMLDDIGANETLLSLVIESIPVGVWIFNENGQIISGNSAGKELWEGSKDVGGKGPVIARAWHAQTKEPLKPEEWTSARAISAGETVINEEIEVELRNGKHKSLLNSAIPLRGKEGKIIGAIAINVDITERKKMTGQLALSESTLQSAFEDSAIGMALVLPGGKFQKVNKELCRMLGYTEQELLSSSYQQITHPADLEEDIHYAKQALDGEINSFQVEKRYVHKNGSIVWAHMSSSLVRDTDCQPLFFVSQIEDIGERKRQEEIILHEKKLSDTMINFMPGIFYVSDINASLLRWNKNLETVTGYKNSEIAHMRSLDFVDPNHLELAISKRREAFENGMATLEQDIITKQGEVLHYYLTIIPIEYNNSPCILGIGVDFTEKNKAEQTIIRFSRLFQFTSAINEMMLHAENKQAIYAQACDIAVKFGKFSMAWIGRFTDEGKIDVFARAGNDEGYLEKLQSRLPDQQFSSGGFVQSIQQQKPVYTNDITEELVPESWKLDKLSHGYRSLISLPIIVGSKVEAVFTLYRSESFFFNEEEVKLLQEVANNIAYAAEKLELKELQKRAEEDLKESEEKFRKLVEETVVGVFILQEDKYVYVNPQFEKISGYSRNELLGETSFRQLIHKDDLPTILDTYLSRNEAETRSDQFTFRGITKNGQVVPIEMIISPISYKAKPAIIGTIIDITEQVEEEKRINRAVTNAQEVERQQISMELHDNVKQMVAASLLNIDFLKMLLKEEKTAGPIIDNIRNYMREAIEELRKISHQLAPSVDNAISLQEKIRSLVNTMNVSNNVAVNYHFEDPDANPGADIQLVMYRILQEQFTNILKHSKASVVDVTVEKRNGDIRLAIEDNGIGFDQMVTQAGIGLENIKRRVQVHNGSYFIQTAPGNGCKLEVNIPLD